jgi:hypothetical protein
MSVFTPANTQELAAIAFRFRVKFNSPEEQAERGQAHRPLVGKEDELLKALRAGEQRYSECRQELKAIRKLRKSENELPVLCADMARKLNSIKDDLTELDVVSREELDSAAQCQGSSIEEMHARLEKLLEWLIGGAEVYLPHQQKMPGRTRGAGNSGVLRLPLEEFAKELRNFLRSPEVGVAFRFDAVPRQDLENGRRELTSATARLLYEAARLLDPRVEVVDIEAVMRAVKRNPEFREELLDDPTVTR